MQICVVGLYRYGGGLIPSTTAVPSAGSSGEHPVQMCVVGLHRHDGTPIPQTTAVPLAGLCKSVSLD